MKKLILVIIIGTGVIAGIAIHLNRTKALPAVSAEQSPPAQTVRTPPPEDFSPSDAMPSAKVIAPVPKQPVLVNTDNPKTNSNPTTEESMPANTNSADFNQAMAVLISKQSSLKEKRTAMIQLRDAGELDQVIAEFKNQAVNNPNDPEIPTALGEAYIAKLQGVQDGNEMGILALQADQNFNAALQIDPSNWDAQFAKASALAGWPEDMNKGPEVIQQLTDLINQQETMPAQPDFAMSYVLLGDQYLKAGNPTYATATWQAGAQLFPSNQLLQKRIANTDGR